TLAGDVRAGQMMGAHERLNGEGYRGCSTGDTRKSHIELVAGPAPPWNGHLRRINEARGRGADAQQSIKAQNYGCVRTIRPMPLGFSQMGIFTLPADGSLTPRGKYARCCLHLRSP